jgi:tetratricopeptide (TPR) repeat protein
MAGRDAIGSGEALELRGDYTEASAAYASALNDGDRAVVADARFHLGRVHWRRSRYDEAVREYEAARTIALELGLAELRARIENGLGVVHHARGEYEDARACYKTALDLTSDDVQRGRVLLSLGVVANIEGDFDSARGCYKQSLELARRAGYVRGEALAQHNLGMLAADVQNWDDAEAAYRRCLDLCETMGDRHMIANVLVNRSEVHCGRQRFADAVADCERALGMFATLGDEAGRGDALRWKGHALHDLGRTDESEAVLTQAVDVAQHAGVRLLEAEASFDLGLSCADRGDMAQARKWLNNALGTFKTLGASRDADAVRVALSGLTL